MKTKQLILIAVGAVLGLFGAGKAWAQDATHVANWIRIESITKVADGQADTTAPLPAGTKIYFDVRLVDTASATEAWDIASNQLTKENVLGARPYLTLNIPLKGTSQKGVTSQELANGEQASEVTNTAVAYYVGQGSTARDLRFAYTVRPGDMSADLTWVADNAGNPVFGGNLNAISVGISAMDSTRYVDMSAQGLKIKNGGLDDTDDETWAVGGYTLAVGDAGDWNSGFLFQGLVPVTVSTDSAAAPTVFTNTTLANQCYFWVEAWDEDHNGGTWRYVPAGISSMQSDGTAITEGTYGAELFDTFNMSYAGRVSGPVNGNATSFETQKFFVNIPASIPAGTRIRLCYGLNRASGNGTTYTYQEFALQEHPFIASDLDMDYELSCSNLEPGGFTLPTTGLRNDKLHGLVVDDAHGGTITAGAGEQVSLQIYKNGIDGFTNYGILYAAIDQISSTNGARCTPERFYVPMNPSAAAGIYTVTFSIGDNAGNGETYYRIRVPQLDAGETVADPFVDEPYYIKVVSSPKREMITFTPGDEGNLGVEYYVPTPVVQDGVTGQSSFLEYKLTVTTTESTTRYFLIYPTDSTGQVRIDPAATYVNRYTDDGSNPVNAFDVLSQYVVLQNQAGSIQPSATAQLVVTIPANQTSATFYVALRNDFPQNYINGQVQVTGRSDPVSLQGAVFAARGCTSNGTVTGLNDECMTVLSPVVQNRAPSITTSAPPTNGATGQRLIFNYSVVDVASDYLIVSMNYGDGNVENRLYVDEAAMIAIMGKAAWESERNLILSRYGITDAVGDPATGGSGIYPRNSMGSESVTFYHTYTAAANPTWNFTVTDSSSVQASVQGAITLTTAQNFLFYTVNNDTLPGTGYILWHNSTSSDPVAAGWSFGESFTSNALDKSGGTSVTATAYPFSAGATTPAGYYEVSPTHDSFFYKWAPYTQDQASLIPDTAVYEPTITINRAYVAGGGEAQSSADWQDITLRTIFVAEYLPGDAYQSFTRSRTKPNLYNLGDYNQDGVPDGWLISALGEDGRTAVEGTSQANVAATDDNLPSTGWGGGDGAYTYGNSGGRLTYSDPDGPTAATGAAFGYRLRVRGRDEALNAADGEGKWLSNPQWVVLIRPEQGNGVVRVGNLANGTLTQEWNRVLLNTSGQTTVTGVTIAFTADNRIPYDSADTSFGGDWRYVVDNQGRPIKAGTEGYQANNVLVNINPASADYEAFRLTYDSWGWNVDGNWGDDSVQGTGATFPFADAAAAQDAMDGDVDTWTGGVLAADNNFYFVDARAVAGLMVDEPFYVDDGHLTDGFLDPRKTSWLERFSNLSSADQDDDGINNGIEYFFWYYASRIAYGSVFTATVNGETHQQLNTALWPAIDLRRRAGANTGDAFTMGRRYRNAYNPDAATNSFLTGGAGNASAGRGNYWEPIPVAEVLAAFHPFVAGDRNADPDNDGLTILEELAIGTNPIDCDTDNDWVPDGWEEHYELDSLNLNPLNNSRNDNDAEANPDRDYFATAQVLPRPDYHHLFKVASVDNGVDASRLYYDYEGGAFYTLPEDFDPTMLKQPGGAEDASRVYSHVAAATNVALRNVTAWAADEALFLEMAVRPVTIRDFEVYQAFGFNPSTGWGVPTPNIPSTEKFADFMAVNTAAFVTREEFNSAVKRANGASIKDVIAVSSDPTSADTNSDGIPDGWAAYVGLRPQTLTGESQDGAKDCDADGLTNAREFQCRAANLVAIADNPNWPASLTNTIHDPAEGAWANKVLPTDPWNMDTDLDGLYDGAEGASTFLYGTPSDGSAVGGGCNPNLKDTDYDGMTDGWEFRYGIAATLSDSLPAEDALLTEEERPAYDMSNGRYVIPSGAPDPTTATDWGLDYDRDGLPNYQEYLTGILRHFRYDLGVTAARLYKDNPGAMATSEISSYGITWTTLPDAYTVIEDLANPGATYSLDYTHTVTGTAAGPDGEAEYTLEPIEVDTLKQAIASSGTRAPVNQTSPNFAQEACGRPGVIAAFNRVWNTTKIFPTAAQTSGYALNVIPANLMDIIEPDPDDEEGMPVFAYSKEYLAYLAVNELQEAIVSLDAAYQRLILNGAEESLHNPQLATYTDQALCTRQVLAQIARIDTLIDRLTTDYAAHIQPALREILQEQTPILWEARKNQILKTMSEDLLIRDDAAYAGMAAIGAGTGQDVNYTGTDPYVAAAEAAEMTNHADYEAAFHDPAVTSPLLQTQYRAAVRGFNGGVVIDDNRAYLAPLGYHYVIRPFKTVERGAATVAGREDGSELVLGRTAWYGDITARNIGAFLPQVTDDNTPPFVTTSPLVADSDADGMDDYWELFHGLNPVLGDFDFDASSNGDVVDRNNYIIDRISAVYASIGTLENAAGNTTSIILPSMDASAVFSAVAPVRTNPFANPQMASDNTTKYDYYSYPWVAGAPFADPDGDGLPNADEAPNPATNAKNYGTDPSALWMTDPANPNSFVTRFYGTLNGNAAATVTLTQEGGVGEIEEVWQIPGYDPSAYRPLNAFQYFVRIIPTVTPSTTGSIFPYEINEGFDTDGDGVADLTELTHTTVYSGDPQTLRSPDRQQAAYFGGRGAMQTLAESNFGPTALRTFTVELWVKPEANQDTNEVILVDRPWHYSDSSDGTTASLRHNFRVGLRKTADGTFTPFANYTSTGTTTVGTAFNGSVPEASPTVTAGTTIKADAWTHLALVYNGSRLVFYVNGTENGSVASSLIPGNGVISVKNDGSDDVQRFTYRRAPIMVGAEPANAWFATLGEGPEREFSDHFRNTFRGYIDELRIWNGVRTPNEIASNRNRTLTQSELLELRLNAFTARYNGGGYYATNVPAELLAMYTFNDLLGGSRTQRLDDEGEPELDDDGEAIYDIDETPWETYPGQKLIGDAETPGSFFFRRKGLEETRAAADTIAYLRSADDLPTPEELFTSYYALGVSAYLKSTKYTEHEYVPMAHSFVSHLPVADVERAYSNLLMPQNTRNGSPRLRMPSGSAANLKLADSVYWTPYGAGAVTNASTTAIYGIKTEGNPYGYGYTSTMAFDLPSHTMRPGYTTYVAPDLLLYGDVYARYLEAGWDDSPSTDPSAGSDDEPAPGAGEDANGMEWFEHHHSDGDSLGDASASAGKDWLDNNVALGQTKDTDGDQMPNWWENYYGLDPEDPTGDNGPHGDPDGDFLTNYAEYLASSNPALYSTAGNGVPDYQIPIWARRGRPTFGLLYTDNDFMEDHWEASNRVEALTVDAHDAQADADSDGWSNWAEARANFRTGRHSTNPNARESVSQTGNVIKEHPTPALRITVDYFGDQNVYTNATEGSSIVVHAYTATNNNSSPDATFKLPLTVDQSSDGAQATISQELGNWRLGTHSGYLRMGNIVPGSLRIVYRRYTSNVATGNETAGTEQTENVEWYIYGDTATTGDEGKLYTLRDAIYDVDGDGQAETAGQVRMELGTINYRTGHYTYTFDPTDEFWSQGVWYTIDGTNGLLTYESSEFQATASYRYAINPGQSNTFTLVTPDSGWIREGINNFYVFADLNGDGKWNRGEPAGIPDQHDVDIGFDQVNKPLHVTLTEQAPPGSVRFDVGNIIDTLKSELGLIEGSDGDESSTIPNPVTGGYLKPSNFSTIFDDIPYELVLTMNETIGMGETVTHPGTVVFRKNYNRLKPYLSEDEIFAERPEGLPRAGSDTNVASSYTVYLIPETMGAAGYDGWSEYAIGVVTNVVGRLDDASTRLDSPVGGTLRTNSELTFEWLSNVQVPTFTLSITKVEDALGNKVSQRVVERTIRGVAPYAQAKGNGNITQYRYRYTLSRGIGELGVNGDTLFGNGLYDYTLTLSPYSGTARTFNSSFRIQMRQSGDANVAETVKEDGTPAQDTSFNVQDSYYVRARINYTGVLKDTADFDDGHSRLVVEAHYSGSFNGDPVASTTDRLVYDTEDETVAALNRTVRMVKDESTLYKVDVPTGEGEETEERDAFWVTRFDVELRGLPTADPVYLIAYFDLNQNGKRDAWEPWGYATQGVEAVGGFYFDPAAVTPVRTGTDWGVSFYIQDVDTDNDKLADAWEWKNAGMPNTDFAEWCNTYNGSVANHQGSGTIWTTDVNGNLALTAYGAQLFGLTVIDGPDANGAVKVEGLPEDVEEAKELMELLGQETALTLFHKGYKSYGLTVKSIAITPEGNVTLTWDVTGATGVEDGATYDVTGYFTGASTQAIYAVYGKADLGDDTWHKLGDIEVAGALTPNLQLTPDKCAIETADGTKTATFFKVILSAKKSAKATLAD